MEIFCKPACLALALSLLLGLAWIPGAGAELSGPTEPPSGAASGDAEESPVGDLLLSVSPPRQATHREGARRQAADRDAAGNPFPTGHGDAALAEAPARIQPAVASSSRSFAGQRAAGAAADRLYLAHCAFLC